MTLKKYREKRDFEETPEPKPTRVKKVKKSDSQGLFFCVQKHAATRLHYDFRLELDGVLLSWAIPKGPSLNPADKRLAIKVEDHPLDYGTFEGIIPAGNYGAGTVMLWDQGTYEATGAHSKKESIEMLRKELEKGHLSIDMHGEKLNGRFNLVQLKNSADPNTWLLIKSKDDFSSGKDVKKLDYSVKSNSTLKKKSPREENNLNG
jgi:bifunctional non-homologous end joining protein LigD